MKDSWGDLSRLTDEELAALPCEEITPSSRRKRRRYYLRGPLDWEDLCQAAQLPGRALEPWLLLHLRWPMKGVTNVTLPNRRLAEMGVDHRAKSRALRALATAGLLRVRQKTGHTAHVTMKLRRGEKP